MPLVQHMEEDCLRNSLVSIIPLSLRQSETCIRHTLTMYVISNLALILCMFCLRPGALMIPRLPRSKDLGSLSPWHCSVKNRKGCMASWSFSSPAAELFNHQLVGISLFFDLLSCGDLKAEPSERKRSNLEAGELSATANSNNQLDSWSTVPSMRHFTVPNHDFISLPAKWWLNA